MSTGRGSTLGTRCCVSYLKFLCVCELLSTVFAELAQFFCLFNWNIVKKFIHIYYLTLDWIQVWISACSCSSNCCEARTKEWKHYWLCGIFSSCQFHQMWWVMFRFAECKFIFFLTWLCHGAWWECQNKETFCVAFWQCLKLLHQGSANSLNTSRPAELSVVYFSLLYINSSCCFFLS